VTVVTTCEWLINPITNPNGVPASTPNTLQYFHILTESGMGWQIFEKLDMKLNDFPSSGSRILAYGQTELQREKQTNMTKIMRECSPREHPLLREQRYRHDDTVSHTPCTSILDPDRVSVQNSFPWGKKRIKKPPTSRSVWNWVHQSSQDIGREGCLAYLIWNWELGKGNEYI
jgi:hypothetical protein